MGAIFLLLAMNSPIETQTSSLFFMSLTAIFMPLSSPNVLSTIYDVTVPEVRSTAQSVEYFIENSGAAFAPILAGVIADAFNMGTAIVWISVTAWVVCFFIYLGALRFVDTDIQSLRDEMAARAEAA